MMTRIVLVVFAFLALPLGPSQAHAQAVEGIGGFLQAGSTCMRVYVGGQGSQNAVMGRRIVSHLRTLLSQTRPSVCLQRRLGHGFITVMAAGCGNEDRFNVVFTVRLDDASGNMVLTGSTLGVSPVVGGLQNASVTDAVTVALEAIASFREQMELE